MKYSSSRESGSNRFRPKFLSSRYVHLKLLHNKIENISKSLLSQVPKNAVVADMGCGERPYEPLFKKDGITYIGIDLPGNSKADLILDPATGKSKLPNSHADVVISIQVLEHVSDVEGYLTECKRILSGSGKLILSTHGYWMFHPDPGDYWRWTREGLELILERHGFNVIAVHGIMGLLSTSLQLVQDAVLLSFPYKKYWGGLFCSFMQLLMLITNRIESKSKSLRLYRDKDASIFCVVAKVK